jgi:predicted ATPase
MRINGQETMAACERSYAAPQLAAHRRRARNFAQAGRRMFSFDEFTVEDAALRRKYHEHGRGLTAVMRQAVEERLRAEAGAVIED